MISINPLSVVDIIDIITLFTYLSESIAYRLTNSLGSFNSPASSKSSCVILKLNVDDPLNSL